MDVSWNLEPIRLQCLRRMPYVRREPKARTKEQSVKKGAEYDEVYKNRQ